MTPLIALALLFGPLRVEGVTACPTPSAVANELGPLLRAEGEPHVARLMETTAGVRIELVRVDGSLVQSRVFPVSAPCERMASAIAAMLAAWEVELPVHHPSLQADLAPPSRPGAAEGRPWQLGLAFVGSLAGGTFAPGGMAEGILGPARIAAVLVTSRDQPLAMGM